MRSKRVYRSKMKIMADIMHAIGDCGEEGAMPTKILYAANLSHDRLTQYLDELVQKGLVLMLSSENGRVYRLSERGSEFLRAFDGIARFAEAFGISI
ncbi:MAG: winged helix-turn-helix domain-containing protein [Candidatus Thorarchaeota archaeon]